MELAVVGIICLDFVDRLRQRRPGFEVQPVAGELLALHRDGDYAFLVGSPRPASTSPRDHFMANMPVGLEAFAMVRRPGQLPRFICLTITRQEKVSVSYWIGNGWNGTSKNQKRHLPRPPELEEGQIAYALSRLLPVHRVTSRRPYEAMPQMFDPADARWDESFLGQCIAILLKSYEPPPKQRGVLGDPSFGRVCGVDLEGENLVFGFMWTHRCYEQLKF